MPYDKNTKKLQRILLRYQQGTATEEECAFVEKYYQQFEQDQQLSDSYTTSEKAAIEKRNWEILMNRIAQPDNVTTTNRVRSLPRWTWAAACITALLLTGSYLWFTKTPSLNRELVTLPVPGKCTKVAYIRNIVLPDGSHVVLQANSRLQFPGSFTGKSRNVTLVGEAYFDIVENTKQPFVIHTGKLKTTVLGTTFNIKAWPEQERVEVSVTSGKVRVEDQKKILAELTGNEQITYQTDEAETALRKVDAISLVTGWTQTDMIFRDEPLEKVAATISKRYNVQIEFKNERLKQCGLVASFSGMETLETVLQTLSAILNVEYSLSSNKIIFDGKGCE